MVRDCKKVSCSIDCSVDSLTALDHAADFAKQGEGQLILTTVAQTALCSAFTIRQEKEAGGEQT